MSKDQNEDIQPLDPTEQHQQSDSARRTGHPTRSIRVPDDLWEKYSEYCDSELTNKNSDLMRYMRHCVKRYELSQGVLPDDIMEILNRQIGEQVARATGEVLKKLTTRLFGLNDEEDQGDDFDPRTL